MKIPYASLVAATILAGAYASPAFATPFYSGSGSATCELNTAVFSSSDCALQTIAAHGAWQQPGAGNLLGSSAQWVSYANTGVSGSVVLAPTPSQTTPTPNMLNTVPWLMKVTEEFSIGSDGGDIDVKFWADDTADVYLNGVLKKGASFTQNTCAGAAIGCQPHEFFQLTEALNPGTYLLDIYVYQTGNGNQAAANPFGLIYGGEVTGLSDNTRTSNQVPAPAASLALMLGLCGLGFFKQRRYRN